MMFTQSTHSIFIRLDARLRSRYASLRLSASIR